MNKTYIIELDAEQLRALSSMVGAAELWKCSQGLGPLDGVQEDVMNKVFDAMDEYYDDNGITE